MSSFDPTNPNQNVIQKRRTIGFNVKPDEQKLLQEIAEVFMRNNLMTTRSLNELCRVAVRRIESEYLQAKKAEEEKAKLAEEQSMYEEFKRYKASLYNK